MRRLSGKEGGDLSGIRGEKENGMDKHGGEEGKGKRGGEGGRKAEGGRDGGGARWGKWEGYGGGNEVGKEGKREKERKCLG